jgi:5-methylcytosine-specific restriction endonuclease McrA
MTRSRGYRTVEYAAQAVYIVNYDIPTAANLVLLTREYIKADRTLYTNRRMQRLRDSFMKKMLKTPDEKGGLTCALCGRKGLLVKTKDKNKLATLDHIIDIGDGGSWRSSNNFQVACYPCNVRKQRLKSKFGLTLQIKTA